jgi:hypothetical protein
MNEQRRDFDDHMAKMAEMSNIFVDQIRKLSELHEEGILTDEEFTTKKQELLSRL